MKEQIKGTDNVSQEVFQKIEKCNLDSSKVIKEILQIGKLC